MAQEEQEQTWGPGEGESAAEAFDTSSNPSPDSKDYVLVEVIHPEADGLRLEYQVAKTEFEESEEWADFSMDDDEVRESAPASERPTSDLSDEEKEAEGRE